MCQDSAIFALKKTKETLESIGNSNVLILTRSYLALALWCRCKNLYVPSTSDSTVFSTDLVEIRMVMRLLCSVAQVGPNDYDSLVGILQSHPWGGLQSVYSSCAPTFWPKEDAGNPLLCDAYSWLSHLFLEDECASDSHAFLCEWVAKVNEAHRRVSARFDINSLVMLMLTTPNSTQLGESVCSQWLLFLLCLQKFFQDQAEFDRDFPLPCDPPLPPAEGVAHLLSCRLLCELEAYCARRPDWAAVTTVSVAAMENEIRRREQLAEKQLSQHRKSSFSLFLPILPSVEANGLRDALGHTLAQLQQHIRTSNFKMIGSDSFFATLGDIYTVSQA